MFTDYFVPIRTKYNTGIKLIWFSVGKEADQ